MYTFDSDASMTMNARHNHANQRLDLDKILIECVKLKHSKFSIVGYGF